jgi:uncharacterized protein (TIGR03435 family)
MVQSLLADRFSSSRAALMPSPSTCRARRDGFTGTYDFTSDMNLDPADRAGAAQITASQEQMGLRLEAAQEPMAMLVIESVQGPPEN